jgi:succinylarginine dihydrolase
VLQQIFHDKTYFDVHPPLPATPSLMDEGAANHAYLWNDATKHGVELFVYGKSDPHDNPDTHPQQFAHKPLKYPARQTLTASQSIARLHKLPEKNVLFLQQSPTAIDNGAFHNDVVFVSNQNVLLYHRQAFNEVDTLKYFVMHHLNKDAHFLDVNENELSLDEAVRTYLFNSQIVSLPNSKEMALIVPLETEQDPRAAAIVKRILHEDNPITQAYFADCRQSMQNGGGPACLRLRVLLPEASLSTLGGNVLLHEKLYNDLVAWVNYHYRDEITLADLLEEKLYYETKTALEELQNILQLKLLG